MQTMFCLYYFGSNRLTLLLKNTAFTAGRGVEINPYNYYCVKPHVLFQKFKVGPCTCDAETHRNTKKLPLLLFALKQRSECQFI